MRRGIRKGEHNCARSSSVQAAGQPGGAKLPVEITLHLCWTELHVPGAQTFTVRKIKASINNCTLLPRCRSHCQNQPHCNRYYVIFFRLLLNYLHITFLAKKSVPYWIRVKNDLFYTKLLCTEVFPNTEIWIGFAGC